MYKAEIKPDMDPKKVQEAKERYVNSLYEHYPEEKERALASFTPEQERNLMLREQGIYKSISLPYPKVWGEIFKQEKGDE